MIKIYAKLPNGKSVFHGELQSGIFKRRIPHNYVRHSDKSFCLNTTVIEELLARRCHTLEFVWLKKEEKVIYRMALEDALELEPVVNEHDERNIRIPIDECYIINRIKREKPLVRVASPMKKKARKWEDWKKKDDEIAEDPQTSMF